MLKDILKISSYIQKNRANPINAFEITIYNTKHTKNTKINFNKSTIFEHFENPYSQKNQVQNDQRFMQIFYGIIHFIYNAYNL